MKKSIVFMLLMVVALSGVLTSCQVIGDIFKAGVWSGVILVVLVIALIIYFIGRSNKS